MSLAGLAVAVAMTWPTLRDPAHSLPQDLGDPAVQAWQLAWLGHALRADPSQLWHANSFYPESLTLAYSDSLLGYAPAGLIGTGVAAAVVRYNVLFVLAHALSFVGAYALTRQLGANRVGSVVAGLAFAYAPWTLAQAGHLNIVSAGGIPLALAMLARGHGWSLRPGHRPERARAAWVAAGWCVATWQLTLGFALGVPFGYVLGGCAAAVAIGGLRARLGGRPWPRRVLATDGLGAALFGGVTLMLARPYLDVVARHPYARRTLGDVAMYSAPPRGLLVAPAESALLGDLHAPARAALGWPAEMAILPGLALMCVAGLGLVRSTWRPRQRVLLIAGVATTAALSLGTRFGHGGEPGFATLHRLLPGWDALRTPGRLVVWTTLLLGVLAAGAITAMSERTSARGRPSARSTVIGLLAIGAVLAEGVGRTPHPAVPAPPAAVRDVAGPALILPAGTTADGLVLLWSTDRFPKLVNGLSGVTPLSQRATLAKIASFPDAASTAYLREIGVRTVVWLPAAAATPWAGVGDRSTVDLGIVREDAGAVVVFHLGESP